MNKLILTLILVFQIGILSAQKNQSNLIVGTWRFEMNCDLRTEQEKADFADIPYCPPITENSTGHADRIFNSNGKFKFYFSDSNFKLGLYKIKNGKLLIENRISEEQANQRPDIIKRYLERNLIEKKDDGFYYYKPQKLNIKSISENQIEFGTDEYYNIWKRVL